MKSSEIANRYGLSHDSVIRFIRENAKFPIKESWWGDTYIVIPDDVDIEKFIDPLLNEYKEKIKKMEETKQAEFDSQEQMRQQQEENERKQKEKQYHLRLDNLRAMKFDGYYEYKVISLSDVSGLFKKNSGKVDLVAMTQALNDLGLEGWHLVTAYSNELGKNALSGGVGGALLGVNSTVDENILIFERYVKI